MSNSLKNTTLVTKYAIKAFMNSLQLAKKVDRQLDEKNVFATKVGATAYIRRPVSFSSTSGAEIVTGDVSDIEEATVAVTLDTWRSPAGRLWASLRSMWPTAALTSDGSA